MEESILSISITLWKSWMKRLFSFPLDTYATEKEWGNPIWLLFWSNPFTLHQRLYWMRHIKSIRKSYLFIGDNRKLTAVLKPDIASGKQHASHIPSEPELTFLNFNSLFQVTDSHLTLSILYNTPISLFFFFFFLIVLHWNIYNVIPCLNINRESELVGSNQESKFRHGKQKSIYLPDNSR